jgi:hypothetical protein
MKLYEQFIEKLKYADVEHLAKVSGVPEQDIYAIRGGAEFTSRQMKALEKCFPLLFPAFVERNDG